MMASTTSFAVTPGSKVPSTEMRMFLAGRWMSVWVASTCSTSEVPIPNAKRAKGTVGRGMRIAADDGHAGLGEALLRPDDVDDALADIVHAEIGHAKIAGVLFERFDLDTAFDLDDALGAVRGRHVMVSNRQRRLRPVHLATRHAQAFECLRSWSLHARGGDRHR